ncbi:transient-receptor-potential-like protein [Galleria mellonella]|uniref:Transient-receptor-potential-like protein n=1 Tax=Galleria mellonella TaxID=7137 RepID=A0A6J3BUG1_GALME|nr:transient-receptor-potential-like protein [Galleria mellonella]XP_031764998.2 transient-receptor-potential-like protein [Galleria mellonella]
MADKKDLECGDPELEGVRKPMDLPTLPKALTLEEKKYLLAVERGDMGNVRRILQKAHRQKHIDVNCVDSLGRGALTLAIDGENMEMVELLVIMGVETKDALLQAINAEFVEAVELLLEHEELIHKDGEPYSWQKVDPNTAMFTPDITPLMLAAHKNNYEILKILLDRGATLPNPHDVRCGCDECIRESTEDSLRHSLARLNEYRALASPSLIALSSTDPILTAFQLSWELRNLAFAEQESKAEYLELRRQAQKFAVDLLDQSRSSQELAIILNHDPDEPAFVEGDHMKLARLELAIDFKQKKFVSHPNIQQLLAAIWYEGVPGFRRKTAMEKIMIICRVALLFPFYCTLYMIAPNCATGKLMRKPFMKFLIHASSYLFFLLILILVSQRAEVQAIQLFGPDWMVKELEKELLKQRGNGPTYLELVVVVYVLGFIWEETQEIYIEGIRSYLRNMWNFIDFTRNSLYVAVALLRFAAYLQQTAEIRRDPQTKFIPREQWDPFDPQLIAEGLFAAANIFSALKLVHLFSINPHLGPLQISLGRMVIDIVKFFFIYSLVLFAFACGLNQLLWYFADLEKKKCYVLPGGLPDWDNAGDSCMKWRSFGNVFEASQSLFWASFGMVGLENFELAGIKSYTRFWGLLMFGSYSVINVIVLLNLLIAMMSNSYAMIDEHSDVEWKFARTRLWMSYFEESATLPPPFNIMPTPKLLLKMLGLRKKDKMRKIKTKEQKEKEHDVRYTAVMRALVWRYVSAMHRRMDDEPVTEDDVNELKGDVSALRYELLEVFEKNGMDVSFTDRKEKMVLGKRMKVWERRLMKDFHVAPVAIDDEDRPPAEDGLAKFRRIAKMAVANTTNAKWDQTLAGTGVSSQIGRCRSRESFKNQQNLQRAMDEARKLVLRSPLPEGSRGASPIEMPVTPGHTLLELIKDISTEVGEPVDLSSPTPRSPWKPGESSGPPGLLLTAAGARSKAASPKPRSPSPAQASKLPSKSATPVLSRGQSPVSKPISSVSEETVPQPEPSPLKSKRVPGESPPKVIKRKPPVPPVQPGDEKVEILADVETKLPVEDIVVARPVAPEIKPTEGAIPPPPPPVKPKAPPAPVMEVTPSTPPVHSAEPPPVSPIPAAKPPSPPKAPTPAPRVASPQPSTSEPATLPQTPPKRLSSTSSTEQLIPPASPEPLRPIKKLEDVKTIKRQPKTGWL